MQIFCQNCRNDIRSLLLWMFGNQLVEKNPKVDDQKLQMAMKFYNPKSVSGFSLLFDHFTFQEYFLQLFEHFNVSSKVLKNLFAFTFCCQKRFFSFKVGNGEIIWLERVAKVCFSKKSYFDFSNLIFLIENIIFRQKINNNYWLNKTK